MNKTLIEYIQEAGLETTGEGELVLPDWVNRIKIDVGLSYSAPNSVQWIREDPNLLVFGFEPLPESCERLRNFISQQEDSARLERQLIILPVALAEKSGIAKMHITLGDTASSSLLTPKSLEYRDAIAVPVFPLSDLMRAVQWKKIQRVDFLKLDCQGVDLDILKSTGDWIQKIAIITAEAEDDQYLGSLNGLRDLVGHLTANGFIHVNPRSIFRVRIGKLLSQFRVIRALKVRLPVRTAKEVASNKLSIDTDDPTFVNRSFLREVMAGEITGFQKG